MFHKWTLLLSRLYGQNLREHDPQQGFGQILFETETKRNNLKRRITSANLLLLFDLFNLGKITSLWF